MVHWVQYVLTGLALMPMSAFAILLLEQSRLYGFAPAVQVLSIMAGMMLLLILNMALSMALQS